MNVKMAVIDAASPDERVLGRAARLIDRGKVLVCPTDTGYAFTANALDTRAIGRVFSLKGRSFSNPIHVAVGSIEEAGNYAHVSDIAGYLARHFLPGALTLVMPKRENIPSILVGGLETIGIRIPDNNTILRLCAMTGRPLTTTSANISGMPTPYAIAEITEQMGEAIGEIALILDQGPIATRELSTIVDLSVDPPQLIRQGKVSWLEVREVLRGFSHSEEV